MKQSLRILFYLFVFIGFSVCQAGAYEDFFKAVGIDDEGTVQSLLQRGFDPNSLDPKGQPALVLALREGSGKVAGRLLEHPDLRVDLANTADETPLMMAALRGNLVVAKKLIERGAAPRRDGWTPLHYAASGPSTPLVEWLLERGAPLEARSPNGTTPLMMAARYGPEDSALALLKHGADPKARNDRDLDAAAFARLGGREPLAERLAALRP